MLLFVFVVIAEQTQENPERAWTTPTARLFFSNGLGRVLCLGNPSRHQKNFSPAPKHEILLALKLRPTQKELVGAAGGIPLDTGSKPDGGSRRGTNSAKVCKMTRRPYVFAPAKRFRSSKKPAPDRMRKEIAPFTLKHEGSPVCAAPNGSLHSGRSTSDLPQLWPSFLPDVCLERLLQPCCSAVSTKRRTFYGKLTDDSSSRRSRSRHSAVAPGRGSKPRQRD